MKTKTLGEMFKDVREACSSAHLVAFDGCHKIYLAMDELEATSFLNSNYQIFRSSQDEMFDKVKEWYEESCGLRFISSVETNIANPNDGYTQLVPQGASDEEEEFSS